MSNKKSSVNTNKNEQKNTQNEHNFDSRMLSKDLQEIYTQTVDKEHKSIVDIYKKLKSGGRKKEDELKEAIVDDALYHDDENIKLKNRSLAIKVMGMDKNVQTSAQNVWLTGGGKDFGKALAQFTGKKSYDITDYVEVQSNDIKSSGDEQDE